MATDRLRREIESLLRGDWRHALGPSAARQPVLGSRGVAVPSKRASAPPVPVLSVLTEHGLIVVDVALLHDDPAGTGADIYPGTAIATWYGSEGWPIPDTSPVRHSHFVGPLVLDADDTPPVITAGHHASVHGVGADNLGYLVAQSGSGGYVLTAQPGAYTGTARAWVQAWLGAGLAPAAQIAALGAGFSQNPGALGLVQDPAGTYWACHVGPTGMIMQRMLVGDTTASLAEWLAAGLLTGQEAALARAYVLADLRPDDQRAQDTVVTADAMAAVYADNAAPLGGGWHWRWQPTAESPAAAVQTLNWPSATGWYARTCTVTISWSEGAPTAVVLVGGTAAWGGGTLHLPPGGNAAFPTGTNAGPATVYSWTTCDGGVSQLVKRAPKAASSQTQPYPNFPNMGDCAAGDAWSASSDTHTAAAWDGGWEITGSLSVAPPLLAYATRTQRTAYATRAPFQTLTCVLGHKNLPLDSAALTINAQWCGTRIRATIDYTRPGCADSTISGTVCTIDSGYSTTVYANGVLSMGAALLNDDTGAVIAWKHSWTGTKTVVEFKQPATGKGFAYSTTDVINGTLGYYYEPAHAAGNHFRITQLVGSQYLVTMDTSGAGYQEAGSTTTSSADADATVHVRAATSSDAVKTLGDGWDGLLSKTSYPPLPWAMISHQGLAGWTDTPTTWTAEGVTAAAFDDSDGHGRIRAWVGGA
jgi:hypothetical protein